mgnify:FL=1
MQYREFGKFIKEKRQKLGFSLNSFAFKNDIDPAILSRIENCKQDIKLNVLNKIAQGFEMKNYELLKEFENK